jgi:hypothetical protein
LARIAGNRLAYHNRLRDPQLRRWVQSAGFHIADTTYAVDQRILRALQEGLPVDTAFAAMTQVELRRRDIAYVCKIDRR